MIMLVVSSDSRITKTELNYKMCTTEKWIHYFTPCMRSYMIYVKIKQNGGVCCNLIYHSIMAKLNISYTLTESQ